MYKFSLKNCVSNMPCDVEAVTTEIYACAGHKMWENVETNYQNLWQFPFFFGSIGGQHILFQAPARSGSFYFKCK